MLEWRVFKNLEAVGPTEFLDYYNQWKKSSKYSVEERTDVYLQLPYEFHSLNRQVGLKLRDVNINSDGFNIELKGEKVEIKEILKVDRKFEIWRKTLKKKLDKKFKLTMTARPLPQDQVQTQDLTLTQSLQIAQQQIQASRQVLGNPDFTLLNEHTYDCDPDHLKKGLEKLIKAIKAKIEKDKIQSKLIQDYLGCFEQCTAQNRVKLIILEKYRASAENSEETLVRIRRIVAQNNDKINFHQYYISCQCEYLNYLNHQDDQLLKKWGSKYEIPADSLNKLEYLSQDCFVGGYPGFLSQKIQ